MRENRTRSVIREGRPALGTMFNAASPLLAEWLGHCGFDFVVVDLQHGENTMASVGMMLQALSSTPTTPMVRVPANLPVCIERVLDLGAYGVIVPQVDTPAEAEAVVRSVRYAPRGDRSFGPIRGAMYGGPDYFSASAQTLLTLVMIESARGLGHAREILSIDGVDAAFIGPADLNISLGHSPDTPGFGATTEEGIATILRHADEAGKFAGIHAFNVDEARRRIAQGFRFVTVMADTRMVRAQATEILGSLRD
jgi:4-hydroxy-2-oxoheptanedioate aldolase